MTLSSTPSQPLSSTPSRPKRQAGVMFTSSAPTLTTPGMR
eukprot:CAMPEP_0198226572 /NCGR_PEP_ID=MMETSP1445-20131203/105770_1 /TAXON_ID=36898 /ORGANISM="Pyramimonas sp., Strain CCMP2087" /LENGTH=39 /DNA_ID= /DNA_START= /DNA_END= /DNA_ORIENTATION=